MRKTVLWVGIFAVLVLSMGVLDIEVSAGESEKLLARAIADYLVAGRTVIAVNQSIINDPSRGDSRFTPSVYDTLVRHEFRTLTGMDISDLHKGSDDPFASNLRSLHESAMGVISMFQARINRPGGGFKGVNPAMFGTWVGQNFNRKTGIILKQTSLKYRATYNQPDDFEISILKQYESSRKATPYYEETLENGKTFARYIVPLYITSECLACHGEPEGELDMTGRAKEGYSEGQLRGGISVVVPVGGK